MARLRGQKLPEFSRGIGVPFPAVRNYVFRATWPGGKHLAAMASAGVDVNWLLTGQAQPATGLESWRSELCIELLGEKVDSSQCAVLGDMRYRETLMAHATALADEFHLRHNEKTGEVLTFEDLMFVTAFWQYHGTMISVDNTGLLDKLAARGEEPEGIATEVMAGVERALDADDTIAELLDKRRKRLLRKAVEREQGGET